MDTIEGQLDALSRLETTVLRGIATYQRAVALVPAVNAGDQALAALAGYLVLLSQQRSALLAAYAQTVTTPPDQSPPAE